MEEEQRLAPYAPAARRPPEPQLFDRSAPVPQLFDRSSPSRGFDARAEAIAQRVWAAVHLPQTSERGDTNPHGEVAATHGILPRSEYVATRNSAPPQRSDSAAARDNAPLQRSSEIAAARNSTPPQLSESAAAPCADPSRTSESGATRAADPPTTEAVQSRDQQKEIESLQAEIARLRLAAAADSSSATPAGDDDILKTWTLESWLGSLNLERHVAAALQAGDATSLTAPFDFAKSLREPAHIAALLDAAQVQRALAAAIAEGAESLQGQDYASVGEVRATGWRRRRAALPSGS
jgi:hypothetical protein